MADADTAVAEPDTAEEELVTPIEAETEATSDAETEGADQADTDGEPEPEETLTRAEADKLIADARADTEKTLRESAEENARKAQHTQRLNQIQQDRQGKIVQDLNTLTDWISSEVENGRDVKGRVDANYIARLAARVDGIAFQEQFELGMAVDKQLFESELGTYEVPRELERGLAQATTAAVGGDPRGAAMMKAAQFRILTAAAKEKARAEWESEQEAENGVTRLKATEATRKGQRGPTQAATGTGGRGMNTIADFERKLASDSGLSDSEWAGYEKLRRSSGLT